MNVSETEGRFDIDYDVISFPLQEIVENCEMRVEDGEKEERVDSEASFERSVQQGTILTRIRMTTNPSTSNRRIGTLGSSLNVNESHHVTINSPNISQFHSVQ